MKLTPETPCPECHGEGKIYPKETRSVFWPCEICGETGLASQIPALIISGTLRPIMLLKAKNVLRRNFSC